MLFLDHICGEVFQLRFGDPTSGLVTAAETLFASGVHAVAAIEGKVGVMGLLLLRAGASSAGPGQEEHHRTFRRCEKGTSGTVSAVVSGGCGIVAQGMKRCC